MTPPVTVQSGHNLERFRSSYYAVDMLMTAFNGPVWRLLGEQLATNPTAAASAPEGRFHHSGQVAAYASLTAEGAAVAIKRYLMDERQRVLIPMWLKAQAVVDVRGNMAASVIWQDQRAVDIIPATWEISDAARRAGAQALLYSSRSRPDLTHVVVFELNCLSVVGPITSWSQIDEPTQHT